jgi:hypothetical protein
MQERRLFIIKLYLGLLLFYLVIFNRILHIFDMLIINQIQDVSALKPCIFPKIW